ncbi:hypothetical protein CK203_081942 [Vitis vinifera]|uniref:DUF1664 domain-containing protein n=1 Tax=Vitis vinifera TaxID=29760 RepID=A0A438DX94_VITVI|nr:hypothetical protein CK203_081942 [Vitis vinifera]
MVYLSWLLMWFEAISGLRINLDKSEILPVGRVENLEVLALEFGCKVGRLPTSYLGLPLSVHHMSVAVWDGLEERFQKTKFGEEEGGWYTRKVREGFGVGFLKEIRKEGSLLQNKVVFSMGDGRKVKFWKDKWCGSFALCNSFPSLYAFVAFKEAWLVELWDSSREEGVWSPTFSRPFNDWEVEEVERLLLTIQGRRLNPNLEDRVLWKETKDGIFSVKSLYSALVSRSVVQFLIASFGAPVFLLKDTLLGWRGINMGKKRSKATKRHLSSRIDRVDCSIDEFAELTSATKEEVFELRGGMKMIGGDVASVQKAVQNLESKIIEIEGKQDITNEGLGRLCHYAWNLENSRTTERIQAWTELLLFLLCFLASPSSSFRPALELRQTTPPLRQTESLPPTVPSLEPPPSPSNPSNSNRSPKPPLQNAAASGLKELDGISKAAETTNTPEVSNGIGGLEETRNGSSGSGLFGVRLSYPSFITRTRSATQAFASK